MILVFGGTTEGRKAIKELEEAGTAYYYSTKTGEQDVALHHGMRIDGPLDREAMLAFCREHGIRLIVDAAHPFAEMLHQTVVGTASDLHLPLIRFERIYPPRADDIIWIDTYADLQPLASTILRQKTLLATTGVQSIKKLKPLEALGVNVVYRILPRESSIRLAQQQGAAPGQLCYYEDGGHDLPLADAVLLKESGISGGFPEKVDEARRRGMLIIALRRPPYPTGTATLVTVNGEHGLRRAVEKLLPEFYPLHSGLTTGTCATAAAVADMLHHFQGETPPEVMITLPNGESIPVSVHYADDYAYVIKDSGDDPDVTKGIEIRAQVRRSEVSKCRSIETSNLQEPDIRFEAAEGIGRFTLPGFDFPPGEPAINRVPREMIRQNLEALSKEAVANSKLYTHSSKLKVTLSVPGGAEIAKHTFNPRLGIEGGISIVGVSGIIKPFSEEAFVDSIRKCMEVAKASGTDRVVINSGAKSERFVRELYPTLPSQAFVEYGNYIGETLRMANELRIPNVTLGVMLGKAVKLAEGQLDTHSRKGTMNKAFIAEMLREAGLALSPEAVTLARELWDLIPPQRLQAFADVVISHCEEHCRPLLPNGRLTILLITDDGAVYHRS